MSNWWPWFDGDDDFTKKDRALLCEILRLLQLQTPNEEVLLIVRRLVTQGEETMGRMKQLEADVQAILARLEGGLTAAEVEEVDRSLDGLHLTLDGQPSGKE